jgi:hypothetical protein
MNEQRAQSFRVELAAHSAALAELDKSPEAGALTEWRYHAKEADNLAVAEAFLARAAQLGVPSRFWFLKGDRGHHRQSVLCILFRRSNYQKGIKALVAAGASPWLAGRSAKDLSFVEARTIADLIFPRGADVILSNRRVALDSALAHLDGLPDELIAPFFPALASSYATGTARSSSTSSGVMGASDKNAKACAQIAIEFSERLLAAVDAHAPQERPGVEAMLADAAIRLAAKTRKGDDGFNPEKLKKGLSDDQRLRMSTLLTLADSCAGDSRALAAVLDDTPWLADAPQILCVNFRTAGSFARAAIGNCSVAGVEALDRLNSNVWLAAAQDGNGNAVHWVAGLLNRYRRDDSIALRLDAIHPALARLLAYGAFLDGSADPITHAVAKADEAFQLAQAHYNPEALQSHIVRLRAAIEHLALADLLEGRDEGGEGGDGEAAQEEAPRRRSGRL